MQKVAVVGAGSWGTTAASLLVRNVPTMLWARRAALADEIQATRQNRQYLPGHQIPDDLAVTSEIRECIAGADAVVMAVPSHGLRGVLSAFGHELPDTTTIISLTKGIEQSSLATMTQVISELCPQIDQSTIGVLTGPNLAQEVVAGQPTAAVVALRDPRAAVMMQDVFMGPTFRVYTHDDVIGCELGGALKNVMAIAAGMSDGLGFGDNTRASLITRALAELTRLGVAMGGRSATFAGLAGMGDLIATCISTQSRNHRVGVGLAQGKSLDTVIKEMRMVAEGVKTTRAVLDLAELHGVDMPIASHVAMVLYDGVHPRDAVLELMTRTARAEPELLD
jgi:glycerol-3-phosphate dehydrogenase (NAD(P)+)